MNAIACGGCAPPVIVETERQRDQRVADELRASRAAAANPWATPDEVAALVKSRLFRQFMQQGFWHAHHVDLVWRYNGEDVREQADWLKDLWYRLRNAPKGGAA